jgi:hypothetical protein
MRHDLRRSSSLPILLLFGWLMLLPFREGSAQEISSPLQPTASMPPSRSPAVPGPELLLLLVRTAMIGIDQANKTGNYAVLREMGGPGLRAYTVSQLAKVFEGLRQHKIDLAPAAVVTPELIEQPVISSEGLLTLAGLFPTKPLQIQFRFVYQADHGSWKPFGLSVSMVPTAVASSSSLLHRPNQSR